MLPASRLALRKEVDDELVVARRALPPRRPAPAPRRTQLPLRVGPRPRGRGVHLPRHVRGARSRDHRPRLRQRRRLRHDLVVELEVEVAVVLVIVNEVAIVGEFLVEVVVAVDRLGKASSSRSGRIGLVGRDHPPRLDVPDLAPVPGRPPRRPLLSTSVVARRVLARHCAESADRGGGRIRETSTMDAVVVSTGARACRHARAHARPEQM